MSPRAVVIGCGLVGTRRARVLVARGFEVTVFDSDSQRSLALVAELGAAVTCGSDSAEAVAQADLTIVATPHHSLAPLAKEALAAGSNVLVEKPGAHTLKALDDLARVAESGSSIVRVGFNHRFHPAVLEARRIIATERFGRVLNFRARYGHGGRLGYEKEWRADPALSGGGELLDQGSHLIDLVRFLVCDVSLAFAEKRTLFWPMVVEDNAFVALDMANGGFAWLHASWTDWKNIFSLELTLESAKIEIDGLGGSYGRERLILYELTPEMGPPFVRSTEWPPGDESWAAETDDVIAAIRGEDSIGATLDDALAVMTIVDEVYQQ